MTTRPRRTLRILLSAYACEPDKGSEPGVGWKWAQALVARGHDVWVLTRSNNRASIELATARIPEESRRRLQFIYYDLPRWTSCWKKGGRGVHLYYALWQRNVVSVARIAHSMHHFDLVHHLTFGVWRQPTQLHRLGLPTIFGPVGGGESAPASLVRTLPASARAWEMIRSLANDTAMLSPGLRLCLKNSRWVIAKTSETAERLRGVGRPSCVSLEIGIDAEQIVPRIERPASDSLKCLFAGRLIGLKGVHLAIEALARARQTGSHASLTIVGRGPMRGRLESLARRLNVDDHVTFVDWLDQAGLFEEYRRHDVLLFPSLHDSSGNVILEAFAHGLPAVCLKLGGPGTLVNTANGIAVDPFNDPVGGLSAALTALSSDPDLRRRLGRGARQYAEKASWSDAVAAVYLPIEQNQESLAPAALKEIAQ